MKQEMRNCPEGEGVSLHKIFKISKITVLVIFFLSGFIARASADIIYLKNGRNIKGLVKSEDEKGVELDLGFGTIKLPQEQVESIDKSSPQEAAFIRQEWCRYNAARQKRDSESQEVGFSKTSQGIVVNVLLNKKVRASLILDTGASLVLLSPRIGKELGLETISLRKGIITKIVLAAGSEADARLIVLDRIAVEGIEAKNIEGAILLKEGAQGDGLLGRSFLNKFNFQIDAENKKLILKKVKPQDILEKTKYFNVTYPSDWEKSLDKEKLIIFGPILPGEENEFQRPYIIIEKDISESAINFAKETGEWYNRWKNLSDIKDKMSELLGESFRNSYPQVQFISSNFSENRDTITLGVLYFFKKYNGKVYSAKIIKKDEPDKSYKLEFFCIDKYFDEYLPVFKRCLESFTINE